MIIYRLNRLAVADGTSPSFETGNGLKTVKYGRRDELILDSPLEDAPNQVHPSIHNPSAPILFDHHLPNGLEPKRPKVRDA